jgi:hypothetical protein
MNYFKSICVTLLSGSMLFAGKAATQSQGFDATDFLAAKEVTRAATTTVPPELLSAWTHTDWKTGYGFFNPDRVDQFAYSNQDPVGWREEYLFRADGSISIRFTSRWIFPGAMPKRYVLRRGGSTCKTTSFSLITQPPTSARRTGATGRTILRDARISLPHHAFSNGAWRETAMVQ